MSHNPGDAATTARASENEQTQTPDAEENAQGTQSAIAQHPTGNVADAIAESPAEAGQPTGAQEQPAGDQSFANDLSDNPQASAAETRNETFQALAGGGQPQTAGTDDQAQTAPSDQSNAQSNAQGNAPTASAQSSAQSAATGSPSPVESAQSATPQPTGDVSEGIADSAEITGGTDPHADDNERMRTQPKPDVSDQDWQELVPKLLGLFNNNREQLGRALGLHRSTVDRWLNGKSKPNTSTILRMRRLAQERRIE
ncbi:MAG: helix-turn-helix domain-containing protein [Blastocatellia bacterium]